MHRSSERVLHGDHRAMDLAAVECTKDFLEFRERYDLGFVPQELNNSFLAEGPQRALKTNALALHGFVPLRRIFSRPLSPPSQRRALPAGIPKRSRARSRLKSTRS